MRHPQDKPEPPGGPYPNMPYPDMPQEAQGAEPYVSGGNAGTRLSEHLQGRFPEGASPVEEPGENVPPPVDYTP
jgi:hypothetical protein